MNPLQEITQSPYFKWEPYMLAALPPNGLHVRYGNLLGYPFTPEAAKETAVADHPVNVGPLATMLKKMLDPMEWGFELDYANEELRIYSDDAIDNLVKIYPWHLANQGTPQYCTSPCVALARELLWGRP